MPRFVILHHDWPSPHWDLFLEVGDMLKAWRLTAEPADATDTPATANHDHRRHYLDYDGPVSGGRGTVTRVAVGTYVGELNETWCVQWNAGTATLSHGPTGLVFRFTDTPLLEELE